MKKDRLERLIKALDSAVKGEIVVNLNLFDNSEFEKAREKYAQEAKEKWGNTNSYKEYTEKTASYTKSKWDMINSDMKDIIFRVCRLYEKWCKSI